MLNILIEFFFVDWIRQINEEFFFLMIFYNPTQFINALIHIINVL